MLSSEHIIGSDDAHDEFLGVCKSIYQRIMDEYLDLWESSNESPHGVLALISTLDTFTHFAPNIVHLVVKRPQIPYWQEQYSQWFSKQESQVIPHETYGLTLKTFESLIESSQIWNKKPQIKDFSSAELAHKMTIQTSHYTQEDLDEFTGIAHYILNRISLYEEGFSNLNRKEHGFLPLITALNLLKILCPKSVESEIAKHQPKQWKELYQDWFSRVEKKLPKDFRQNLYDIAISEFDFLIGDKNEQ